MDVQLRDDDRLWEAPYQPSPMFWLGTAFLGGILTAIAVAKMTGPAEDGGLRDEPSRRALYAHDTGADEFPAASADDSVSRRMSQATRQMRMALVNVAIAKAVDYLEDLMPGYRNQFEREAL